MVLILDGNLEHVANELIHIGTELFHSVILKRGITNYYGIKLDGNVGHV